MEIHKFEKAGLGKAPFRVTGNYESIFRAVPEAPGGKMENTITLKKTDQCWMAEYSGPIRAEIYNLFGTAEIPTAFTIRATWQVVQREIQRLNPDCNIIVR